jgi:hypothetical protein
MTSILTNVPDSVQNPVQIELLVRVREPKIPGVGVLELANQVVQDVCECLGDSGFIALVELTNPDALSGAVCDSTYSDRLHSMLDLALRNTLAGESFLPEFMRIVLKDQAYASKFVISAQPKN